MVYLFLAILFLAQIITAGICQLPQSPCPKYFRYYQDEMNGEIMGMVEIPSPLPRGVPLMLKVTLNLPTFIPTKYNGSLELVKSEKVYAPVQQAIDQGKSLFFRIRFPVQRPLPLLKEIAFNNRPKCLGPTVMWPIVTFIHYEKTVYPPELLSLLYNQSNSNNLLNHLPQFTNQISNSTTFMPPANNFEIGEHCGFSQITNLSMDIRIDRGEKTYPGQWPWLAAIFFVSDIDFDFQCIGNLVSRKHIITVAHCLKPNGIDVPAKAVSVSLGKHFLEISNESGSLKKTVSEIKIHPDFHKSYYPNADSDLAILVFKEPVKYTMMIQPICLWKKMIDLEKIVGETGIVVGWGKYEKSYIGEPRKSIELIVSQEDCLRSDPGFRTITSNRTFCASNRYGRGPCNGDSGSGFLMLDSETGRYHLRGIAAMSLFDKETESCNLKQYIVFVDVAKHHDWIEKQISNDLD